MRKPPKFYALDGDDGDIGVIRYDGDRETWDRLVTALLRHIGEGESWAAEIAEPNLRWFRFNVCAPDHYMGWPWQLTPVDGPGRGRWQGALVRWKS